MTSSHHTITRLDSRDEFKAYAAAMLRVFNDGFRKRDEVESWHHESGVSVVNHPDECASECVFDGDLERQDAAAARHQECVREINGGYSRSFARSLAGIKVSRYTQTDGDARPELKTKFTCVAAFKSVADAVLFWTHVFATVHPFSEIAEHIGTARIFTNARIDTRSYQHNMFTMIDHDHDQFEVFMDEYDSGECVQVVIRATAHVHEPAQSVDSGPLVDEDDVKTVHEIIESCADSLDRPTLSRLIDLVGRIDECVDRHSARAMLTEVIELLDGAT